MLGIAGNYTLRLKFGDTDVPLDPSGLNALTIIQDYNSLLPSFTLKMTDSMGILTHVNPFDQGMSRVSMEIGNTTGSDITNTFSFIIHRRKPISINVGATQYEVVGLLNIPNLFNPTFIRANYGMVSEFLERIAMQELLADGVNISAGFNVGKNILQPNWSNAELFKYLRHNWGDEAGYCYYPFFTVKGGKQTFNFTSLEDMCVIPSKYKFIINDEPYQDYRAVYEYQIFDNYYVQNIEGVQSQRYSFFNYYTGAWEENILDTSNYLSLSDYIMSDRDDTAESKSIDDNGRNNDFTLNFAGKMRNVYYNRINDLTKMWITTMGISNIVPGDVVKVLFAQGILMGGSVSTYQYSGFWLVERVVHTFSNTFITKLMLTRAGVDTGQTTSLIPAQRRKVE